MNSRWHHLEISFCVRWESPWHVGSGMGTVGVDRLLRFRVAAVREGQSDRRVLRRVPYVPGSQLKGVLRHQCERLYAAWAGKVVPVHAGTGAPPKELLHHFGPLVKSPLLVDRLFGNRFQGECLFVEDALPESWEERSWLIMGRTAVDRRTGTVREGTLFFTQVGVSSFPPLRSRVLGRHPPGVLTQDGDAFPFEYALLVAALMTIDALGADKSAGFGRCQLRIENIRWNEHGSLPLEDALRPLEDPEWPELAALVRENSPS